MAESIPAAYRPRGGRPPAMGRRWIVTAPHALAAQAGGAVLDAGGTAADAAVAMAATLGVVYPHMTGIGGDLFALYYDSQTGEVVGYNGSGAAAALATLDFYTRCGLRTIPERGGPAALTVPGAVDAWFALHERFGKIEMSALLAPAIAFARDGAPIARSLARSIEEDRPVLDADEGARHVFGGGTGVGDVLLQPALARTLEAIADRGRDWFYGGEAAVAIDAYCQKISSPLRSSDFAAHRGFWTTPIRTAFRGCESLTTPPNSQGLALLLAQSIYEEASRTHRADDCSAGFVHATVEATRLAYEDRDRYVADPQTLPAPVDRLLAPEHSRARARLIDPNRAGRSTPAGPDLGGTTYFACIDDAGNAASVIQSIYQHFGAAVVVPELGLTLHDRGCWFTLDEGAVRSLVPGRRPFHTLIANMLLRDGKPWLVYGSMGGDAQPQIGLALSIRIAERAMDPQAAIEAPRWRWGGSAVDLEPEISIESRAGAACVAGLRARGHRVAVCEEWEETMGHAGAIVIDRERGVLFGGSDPRSDGAALGG